MIDSWNPFDMSPRTKWYQSMFVGVTWAALAWSLLMLAVALLVGCAQPEPAPPPKTEPFRVDPGLLKKEKGQP